MQEGLPVSGLGLQVQRLLLLLASLFLLQQRSQPMQAAAVLPGGSGLFPNHCGRHQKHLYESAGRTTAARQHLVPAIAVRHLIMTAWYR
jgi:hypothetical protein